MGRGFEALKGLSWWQEGGGEWKGIGSRVGLLWVG